MKKNYDNTNSGVLFRNDKKQPGDKLPDYTGKLNINGEDWRLAAWLRESSVGNKFLSLKVSKPQPAAHSQAEQAFQAPAKTEDVPF